MAEYTNTIFSLAILGICLYGIWVDISSRLTKRKSLKKWNFKSEVFAAAPKAIQDIGQHKHWHAVINGYPVYYGYTLRLGSRGGIGSYGGKSTLDFFRYQRKSRRSWLAFPLTAIPQGQEQTVMNMTPGAEVFSHLGYVFICFPIAGSLFQSECISKTFDRVANYLLTTGKQTTSALLGHYSNLEEREIPSVHKGEPTTISSYLWFGVGVAAVFFWNRTIAPQLYSLIIIPYTLISAFIIGKSKNRTFRKEAIAFIPALLIVVNGMFTMSGTGQYILINYELKSHSSRGSRSYMACGCVMNPSRGNYRCINNCLQISYDQYHQYLETTPPSLDITTKRGLLGYAIAKEIRPSAPGQTYRVPARTR